MRGCVSVQRRAGGHALGIGSAHTSRVALQLRKSHSTRIPLTYRLSHCPQKFVARCICSRASIAAWASLPSSLADVDIRRSPRVNAPIVATARFRSDYKVRGSGRGIDRPK